MPKGKTGEAPDWDSSMDPADYEVKPLALGYEMW